MGNLARAQAIGVTEMEASPEVIAHYNPNGLGDSKYFILQGIHIYPEGESEEIKANEAIPLSQKLHGAKEGKLIGL